MGEESEFLGIAIQRTRERHVIRIIQSACGRSILLRFNMQESKGSITLIMNKSDSPEVSTELIMLIFRAMIN